MRDVEGRRRVFVVGGGRVGAGMALLLHAANWPVVGVWKRQPRGDGDAAGGDGRGAADLLAGRGILRFSGYPLPPALGEADVVLLAVPDRALHEVALNLATSGHLRPDQHVLHTSGAFGPDALEPLVPHVAGVGVVHPLQACATPAAAVRLLPGSAFLVEADGATLEAARDLVAAVGGRYLSFGRGERSAGRSGDRGRYHAAACMAGSLLASLVARAAHMVSEEAGLPPDHALDAVLRLARGALQNLETLGLPRALTGPAVRGDHPTLARHRAALAPFPEEQAAYDALSRLLEGYLGAATGQPRSGK